jgi:hypothetical protein
LEHAVQLAAVLVAAVYVPAAQLEHTPSVPIAPALPEVYAVLKYWPAGHVATAAARPVSLAVVHTLVTYWLPAAGRVHAVAGHVALVPAVAPEPL